MSNQPAEYKLGVEVYGVIQYDCDSGMEYVRSVVEVFDRIGEGKRVKVLIMEEKEV